MANFKGKSFSKLSKTDNDVIDSINILYKEKGYLPLEENPSVWITTREIAESCGMSIYSARYSLLKLKCLGFVIQAPSTSKCPMMRWKPSVVLTNYMEACSSSN